MVRFGAEFAELIRREGLEHIGVEEPPVRTFDEVPLYSMVHQIDFLSGLPVEARNRLLIAAAVEHLLRIEADILRASAGHLNQLWMVSIVDWHDWIDGAWRRNDGTKWLFQPRFWVSNMAAPELSQFFVEPGESKEARFVRDSLPEGVDAQVYESWMPWGDGFSIERVYVRVSDQPALRVEDRRSTRA